MNRPHAAAGLRHLQGGILRPAEEFVKDPFHGGGLIEAFQATWQATSWPLLGLTVICFCLFIPFFALWEVRRVMGEK